MYQWSIIMYKVASITMLGILFLASVTVNTQASTTPRPVIIETSLSFSDLSRSGNALNQTGPLPSEIRKFQILSFTGLVALPIGDAWLLQFEINSEKATVPDFSPKAGGATDDTYKSSFFTAAQFGYNFDTYYLGGFAGTGKTKFTLTGLDQNTNFDVFGLTGALHIDNWSFGGQIGMLDSNADNEESLSEASFAVINAKRFFNHGKTSLNMSFAYADGDQDGDRLVSPNPLEIWVYGVTLEHTLPIRLFGSSTSVFAAIERIGVREESATGNTDKINDTTISIGLKVRFGAKSQQARARNTAPQLPNFGRWLGSVPAVD